jgi:hypothetical protein
VNSDDGWEIINRDTIRKRLLEVAKDYLGRTKDAPIDPSSGRRAAADAMVSTLRRIIADLPPEGAIVGMWGHVMPGATVEYSPEESTDDMCVLSITNPPDNIEVFYVSFNFRVTPSP